MHSPPSRVDHAAGVIYGVKILGWESPNRHGIEGVDGTVYDRAAVQEALQKYEGARVNKNHPPRDKSGQERSVGDRIGWLENVRVLEGGLFGDLHLLMKDDDAAKILEAAEKNPALFGLSHNALGKWEIRNGKAVIVEIPEVRSVDIVTEGGTTRSLFESKETVRQNHGTAGRGALSGKSRLNENEMMGYPLMDDQGMPMDAAMPAASKSDHLLAAIKAAFDEGDMEFAQKVFNLAKSAVSPKEEPAAPAAESEGDAPAEDEKKEDKEDEMKESRMTEDRAKSFCTLAGVPADAELLEALTSCATEGAAIKLLEWTKKKIATPVVAAPAPAKAQTKVVATAPVAVQESKPLPEKFDDYLSALRTRGRN